VPSCVLSGYAVIWLLTEITDDFGGTREKMGFRLFCSHLISYCFFFLPEEQRYGLLARKSG